MQLNDQKEDFSFAYIMAVAARAGFWVDFPRRDRRSVDGVIRSDFGKQPTLRFQAKATAQSVMRNDGIHFPLPIKNYNDLREETISPQILIVVLLPSDTSDWLSQSQDELCMRRCGYWRSLAGEPEVRNTSTHTVRIPTGNVFDDGSLSELMRRAGTGAL